jgi:hypothetical protein
LGRNERRIPPFNVKKGKSLNTSRLIKDVSKDAIGQRHLVLPKKGFKEIFLAQNVL